MAVVVPALTQTQQILTHFFKEEEVCSLNSELLRKAFLVRGACYSCEVTSGNNRFYYYYKTKMEYKKSENKETLFIFVLNACFSSERENSKGKFIQQTFRSLSEKAYCFERENVQGGSSFSYKRCCHWLNKDGRTIKIDPLTQFEGSKTHFPCFQNTKFGKFDFKSVPYANFFNDLQNRAIFHLGTPMFMACVETEAIKDVLKGSSKDFTRFRNAPRSIIDYGTK